MTKIIATILLVLALAMVSQAYNMNGLWYTFGDFYGCGSLRSVATNPSGNNYVFVNINNRTEVYYTINLAGNTWTGTVGSYINNKPTGIFYPMSGTVDSSFSLSGSSPASGNWQGTDFAMTQVSGLWYTFGDFYGCGSLKSVATNPSGNNYVFVNINNRTEVYYTINLVGNTWSGTVGSDINNKPTGIFYQKRFHIEGRV
ncbi:hypothetical protein DFA_08506 [Cavenderia fasciculata]|uniref:Uncharacterized protein n=1 Tax=Cavenderia fasciculata TaxID=261658 RepID=F4Q2P3_CACFS|nr:uncharacterized protein DFA_08506 [Cavenderia fasciculata]EGG17510.1 hypothetical protein DFA_08506 [Cavenderia fasciculata]|eukprot:XP_004355994.1 hypothetical protein DFA_08506 [Cavenderia fasciculata]